MRSSLDACEQYLPNLEARNPAVSQWSVREQMHHALLSGRIPRGRAQAPKQVRPSAEASREELEGLLARARQLLTAAEASDPKAWFEHFVFGVMYRDAAIKLLHIQTRHHLAIIADILK